ncbi:hypothetical protein [Streptomyces regalis]|uniref:hypothetical protein n=1 Tax=Streptomyces regalis TaxID=68262 RepID=UPI000AA58829|nr:hypothetical protein [Streptomyces regalis]
MTRTAFVFPGPGTQHVDGLIRRILPDARVHATGTVRQLALTADALTPSVIAG